MEHPLLDEKNYVELAEKITKLKGWIMSGYEGEEIYPLTAIALALIDIAKTLKEKK